MGYINDLRRHVGQAPLLMPAGCVLILNDKDQLLLQKRRDNGCWGYPGGAMEMGESFEECAIREAYEETGLTCRALKLVTMLSGPEMHYIYPNGDEVYVAEALYVCRDWEGELRVQESEVVEQGFFDLDKLPKPLFSLNELGIRRFLEAWEKRDPSRPISVRRAVDDDRQAIGEIFSAAWKAAYAGLMSADYLAGLTPQKCMPTGEIAGNALVAGSEGRVAGIVTFGPSRDHTEPGHAELVAIYVLPEFWRQGFGTALFAATRAELTRQGYERMSLWVLRDNRRARSFYEKMGMTRSGERTIEIAGDTLPEVGYTLALGR